jgi:uncharacterized membrane protein YcaP (DUF421 family)
MNPKLWTDMFSLGLPLLEKILRPVIFYLFLVIALRLAGKRELAQLNPFDLVVLMSLSNTVQNAIIGEDNSVVGGLIGAASLLAINAVVVRLLYTHPKLEEIAEGKPDALIEKGRIKEAHMKRERITKAELTAVAMRQGFRSLDEVESAVLEPGGAIAMSARLPTPETSRHQEIVERLDRLTRSVEQLRGGGQPAGSGA